MAKPILIIWECEEDCILNMQIRAEAHKKIRDRLSDWHVLFIKSYNKVPKFEVLKGQFSVS